MKRLFPRGLRGALSVLGLSVSALLLSGCYTIVSIPSGQVDLDYTNTRHNMPDDLCPSPVSDCCSYRNLPNGVIRQFDREWVSGADRTLWGQPGYQRTNHPAFYVETWYENAFDASYKRGGCRNGQDVIWYYRDGKKHRKVTRTVYTAYAWPPLESQGPWQNGWK